MRWNIREYAERWDGATITWENFRSWKVDEEKARQLRLSNLETSIISGPVSSVLKWDAVVLCISRRISIFYFTERQFHPEAYVRQASSGEMGRHFFEKFFKEPEKEKRFRQKRLSPACAGTIYVGPHRLHDCGSHRGCGR